MKKIFSFIIVVLLAFSCKAQTIIPLQDFHSSIKIKGEISDNTYFKDTSGILKKYIGCWEGEFGDKFYKFKIEFLPAQKADMRPSVMFDETVIRYQILNKEKVHIYRSTFNLENNSTRVIRGRLFDKNNFYTGFYIGLDDNDVFCGDKGTIHLDIAQDGKTMKLFIIPSEALISEKECPNGGIDPPFPDETEQPMVLKKL